MRKNTMIPLVEDERESNIIGLNGRSKHGVEDDDNGNGLQKIEAPYLKEEPDSGERFDLVCIFKSTEKLDKKID